MIERAIENPVTTDRIAEYSDDLDSDPQYSLEPDPTGSMGFTDEMKEFVKNYIQFRSIPIASQLTGITADEGTQLYKLMSFKKEVRRISNAMYCRQFCKKMLDVDQIGGYLTSVLTDDNVAEVDRLSTKDKIQVAKLIADLNVAKSEMVHDPAKYNAIEVEAQVRDLSVDSIKSLLVKSKENDEEAAKKEALINDIDPDSVLSNEELMQLRAMSAADLLKLYNEQQEKMRELNMGGNNDDDSD